MAEKKSATKRKSNGFSNEERAALRQRAKELKAAASRADEESSALAAIAALAEPDRAMAERMHALVEDVAPELAPKTWYGMPAYAKDGSVVCFFQSGAKFKTRYATLGFSDKAKLDDGTMWPVAFALTEWTPANEARIAELVKRAAT